MGMIDREEINCKQLIEERQWQELREKLKDVPIPDIADLLMELSKAERVVLFRVLPRTTSSEVFSYMTSDLRNSLLKELTDEEARNLLSNLRPDDRTTLFEELPGQVTQKLLNLLSPQDIKETRFLLGYPEESVGRLMTPDYVAVRPEWTVEQSLQHIRLKGKDSETLNVIYVTDEKWKLLDSLDLHRFILSPPDARVSDLMDRNFVSIPAFDDRENAVYVLQHYDLFVLPVVDSEGILLGIVTADDIMDVAEEEATEDFHKTAAVAPLKNTYREASIWELYNKRIYWLVFLVFVSLLSAGIIGHFESTLQKVIILSVFIPMLTGSGGNTGAQSATMIVRALATGDIEVEQWSKTVRKEILVGIFLGLTMGAAGFILGYIKGGAEIAFIIGITMFCIILVANLIGVALPFILTRLGMDPAVASNPLIASLVDATGLLIYFFVAVSVLQMV
ncbi:MAG: magnesium transporter [Syntrophomonadaceae bacterium]|jgi:magnesium transporter|nr:magnesium transporter [Syntrophomonadaceae bacterium]